MTANSKLYYTLLAEAERQYALYCAACAAAARVSASDRPERLREEIWHIDRAGQARKMAASWDRVAELHP